MQVQEETVKKSVVEKLMIEREKSVMPEIHDVEFLLKKILINYRAI